MGDMIIRFFVDKVIGGEMLIVRRVGCVGFWSRLRPC